MACHRLHKPIFEVNNLGVALNYDGRREIDDEGIAFLFELPLNLVAREPATVGWTEADCCAPGRPALK
jgi:hypothetical protein